MADLSALTVTVEVKQRSLFVRIVRLPLTFGRHYRVLRESNGRLVSAYGAWVLAGLIVKVK